MSSLQDLRNRLKAEQEKQTNRTKSFENNESSALFPFWKLEAGQTASLRFLPDGNKDSGFFWLEKVTVKLPFAGIKGVNTNPTSVIVPCMYTWNEKCPIQDAIKPLWTDDAATAKIYWRKKAYLFHGFVRKSDFVEENPPENTIRKFALNKSIFDIVHAGLMNPEIEDMPTDYQLGRDFYIKASKQGQYADYSTSSWSMKATSLTESEALAIEKNGIPDIATYLPAKPDSKTLDVIMEMYLDSLNGNPYDPDKYADYYKPFGLDTSLASPGAGSNKVSTSVGAARTEPVETNSTSVTQPDSKKPSVQDLLATIKKNQQTAASK